MKICSYRHIIRSVILATDKNLGAMSKDCLISECQLSVALEGLKFSMRATVQFHIVCLLSLKILGILGIYRPLIGNIANVCL